MAGGPLPPLAAVRVFEAAARHGNFTRAAAELRLELLWQERDWRLVHGRDAGGRGG